jgi:hypothetical protein
MTKRILAAAGADGGVCAGFAVRGCVPGEPVAFAQGNRVFELRTYTSADGKLDALHKRFRDETVPKFFPRHGMANVWYGKPMDAPLSQNSMTYHDRVPEPRRRQEELGCVPRRSGMGQGGRRVRGRPGEDRVGLLRAADYSPLK